MKNLFLFLLSFVIFFSVVGCVGPRTGSVGYQYEPPVLVTNITGTVSSQQVGLQPPVVYAQTNFTVVSTPPVQTRTWKEKAFGQRPPADYRSVPPMPDAAYGGVAPTAVQPQYAPPAAVQPEPRGVRYDYLPNGAPVLRPSRSQATPQTYGAPTGRPRGSDLSWGQTFRAFGRGFFDFSSPTTPSVQATAWTGNSGRVRVPVTSYERKVAEYNGGSTYPSLATGVYPGTYAKPALDVSGTLVGAGEFRSGLGYYYGR
ncbi:MAG: hypothetical protein Q8P12_02980 [bacterium]|nr:hypothetical protein [bacterium]